MEITFTKNKVQIFGGKIESVWSGFKVCPQM